MLDFWELHTKKFMNLFPFQTKIYRKVGSNVTYIKIIVDSMFFDSYKQFDPGIDCKFSDDSMKQYKIEQIGHWVSCVEKVTY